MPYPTECQQISPLEEEFAECVFERAYGGHLRAMVNPGAFWDTMDLRDSVAKQLVEKSGPDAQSRFYKANEEFAWELVPLSTTHATFVELFDLMGDQTLRAQHADFLDAPLNTPEEESIARAALCRILGLPSTVPRKPNADEITAQFNSIFEHVQVRCKDQPEKLVMFLSKFLAMGAEENPGETIRELIPMVSSETDLVWKLEKLHKAFQKSKL
ncbi:hypothetical protein QQZ08_009141 [Neonectria magnoliae]|uniref:Uncharacterized protein n=1 Tax=Neonectria magnoliae TaxID=2732573 RepID=A0ABR1HQV5_9HYPO